MGRQDPAARRVSNLTSSQIERKRAIDRANQQHCQRRKKARLQWLEEEVARLGQKLDIAEARIKLYEEQCVCGSAAGGALHSIPGTEIDDAGTVPEIQNIQDMHHPQLSSEALLPVTREENGGGGESHDNSPGQMDTIWTVSLRELLEPGENEELDSIIFQYPLPFPDMSAPLIRLDDIPEWQIIPLHLPPETDLDRFIIDTTNSGRRLQQQTGAEELSQAQFPSISSLLNPNLGDDGTRPLTSALAMHVVQKSAIKSITTRIAMMYTLSYLLRWLVCRDRQSYEKLPDFLKPTHLQRTVPHPAWVDVITWPQARDNIIRENVWTSLTFDEFRRITGAYMSVNWPYTDSGAFLDLGDGQSLVLSPIFENHIRRAENWTLDPTTVAQFPFMKEFCATLSERSAQK